MSGTWRRAEGSAEMAAPECIETRSELQEVRPLSLIEECESLLVVGEKIISFRGAVNVAGTNFPCEAIPLEDVFRQIMRIAQTRPLTPRAALAKKTALELFADQYGDPAGYLDYSN